LLIIWLQLGALVYAPFWRVAGRARLSMRTNGALLETLTAYRSRLSEPER
jgi:hypothetical protein